MSGEATQEVSSRPIHPDLFCDTVALAGSGQLRIHFLDVHTGKEFDHIEHEHRLWFPFLLDEDATVWTTGYGSYDIVQWDVVTKTKFKVLHGHTNISRALCTPRPHLIVSGGNDNKILFWCYLRDSPSERLEATLTGHTQYIYSVVYLGRESPSCQGVIFSNSYDRTVRVWSIEKMVEMSSHSASGSFDAVLGHLPFVNMMVSASFQKQDCVQMWDLTNGGAGLKLVGSTNSPQAMHSLHTMDDSRFVVGGNSGKLCVYDVREYSRPQMEWDGHSGRILGLTRVTDESFVSTSVDGFTKMWNIGGGSEEEVWQSKQPGGHAYGNLYLGSRPMRGEWSVSGDVQAAEERFGYVLAGMEDSSMVLAGTTLVKVDCSAVTIYCFRAFVLGFSVF